MIDLNSFMGEGSISQLARIEENLEDFMETMPFCIAMIDEQDKVIFKNSTTRSSHGFDLFDACIKQYPKVISYSQDITANAVNDSGQKEEFLYLDEKDMWISCTLYATQMKTVDGKKVAVRILRDITESKKTQDKLMTTIQRLTKLSEAGIKTIEKIVEHRDPYTATHQKNTGEYAYLIANKMGLDEENAQKIRYAGMVHDVGKVSIPVMILNKPSNLKGFELDTIKHHVEASYDILKNVDEEIPVAEMVLHHHERLDGSGYPNGLKSESISQGGKILAVADVLDAMTSHRPHRPKMTFEDAIIYFKDNSGRLYDMRVVLAVFELFREGRLFTVKSKKSWI